MNWSISASVGRNGVNFRKDVIVVQQLLNGVPGESGGPITALKVDGLAWSKTTAAIERFQKIACGFQWPDGRVDPGGKTLVKLCALGSPAAPGSDPNEGKCGNTFPIVTANAKSFIGALPSKVAGQSALGLSWPGIVPRPMNSRELGVMGSVFGTSIDPTTVLIVERKPPRAGGMVIAGVAPAPIWTYVLLKPGFSNDLLIHELTHVWQSQHHFNPIRFMANSVLSFGMAEALTSATGKKHSAYKYSSGSAFWMYAAEQIAEQVEDGVSIVRAHVRALAHWAVDPDNILSLSVPRAEPL